MLNSSIGKNKSVVSENKFVAEIIDLFSELKIPPADAIRFRTPRGARQFCHKSHLQKFKSLFS